MHGFLKSDTLLYLKRYEPIGCRDPYSDYRVSWVSKLGVTIYTKEMIDGVDWHPAPIPFEEEKALLIKQFRQTITEATMRG